jgi:DNA-binding CsgD family transcriptional regulator
VVTEAQLLTDIARLGDPASVRDRLNELAEASDAPLVGARATYVSALVARDPGEIEKAADRLHSMGCLLVAAEGLTMASSLYRAEGNRARAAETAELADMLARQCQGAATPGLVRQEGQLTLREREIAQLAINGLTSPEIAAELAISRRTVDSHLHHIYRKTGVNRRSELGPILRRPNPV